MSGGSNLSLTREQIVSLLAELGQELDAHGIHAQMFVVGGAAMALAYNTRRMTADVDGVFEPKMVIYAAARQVAAETVSFAHWKSGHGDRCAGCEVAGLQMGGSVDVDGPYQGAAASTAASTFQSGLSSQLMSPVVVEIWPRPVYSWASSVMRTAALPLTGMRSTRWSLWPPR
jgi:hypothetical protein